MEVSIRRIGPEKSKKINGEYFLVEVKNMVGGEAKDQVVELFERTVRGWHSAPDFTAQRSFSKRQIAIKVAPHGKTSDVLKYIGVNNGIPSHWIAPRNRNAMKFKVGYKAATKPGRIGSSAYKRSGSWGFSKGHRHPGTEARKFDKAIAKVMRPKFRDDIENAVRRAAHRI